MASDHVTFDAASSDDTNAVATNYDWDHLIGGGAYRILIVAVASDGDNVSSVVWDYGGDNTALIQLGPWTYVNAELDIWYLLDPKSGTFGIRVVMVGATYASCGAVSYENVLQSSGAFTEGDRTTGSSATWSNGTTVAEGNLAIGFNAYEGDAGVQPTVNTGTDRVSEVNTGGALATRRPLNIADNDGTGTVTIELTTDPISGHDYVLAAYELNHGYPAASSQGVIFS